MIPAAEIPLHRAPSNLPKNHPSLGTLRQGESFSEVAGIRGCASLLKKFYANLMWVA